MSTYRWKKRQTHQCVVPTSPLREAVGRTGAGLRLLLLPLIIALLLVLPAVSPARSLYVVNDHYIDDDNPLSLISISQYDIDSLSGALTIGPLMVDGGVDPRSIVVSPDGKSAYVVNSRTLPSASISQYDIDSRGVLSAKYPPTVAADGFYSQDIAISPDGKNAYVAGMYSVSDIGDHSVTQYDIDPATGALTQKSPAAVETGAFPTAVAISPDGKSAYVANFNGSNVSQYDILDSATGVLTPKDPDDTVAAGTNPDAIVVHPSGGSAYVTNGGDDTVSQYNINSTSGALELKSPSTLETGDSPSSITVSPDGTNAYVANKGDGVVSQYRIDQEGNLSTNGTATAGVKPTAVSISPNGGSAYVTNEGSDTVSPYGIDPSTGKLSPTSTAVATGLEPQDIAMAPNQGPTAKIMVDVGYAGQSTTFSASGSNDSEGGEIVRYDWNFGDGSTLEDAGPTPSHAYSSPGRYNVTLTVTDNEGCSNEVIFTGQTAYCNGSSSASISEGISIVDPPTPPGPAPSPSPLLGPAPSPSAQTASFSEACNLKITSPKLRATKTNVMRVSTSKIKRLFTHGVKGTMRWGTINGKDVVCKKIKMVLLQQRGRSYYIPGTRTRVSKKILTGKTFSTRGASFLKKKKVGKLRKKTRSSKRLTKISYKDFNRRSKRGRSALNSLRKKGYHGRFLVLYNAEIDGTTVLKKIRLRT